MNRARSDRISNPLILQPKIWEREVMHPSYLFDWRKTTLLTAKFFDWWEKYYVSNYNQLITVEVTMTPRTQTTLETYSLTRNSLKTFCETETDSSHFTAMKLKSINFFSNAFHPRVISFTTFSIDFQFHEPLFSLTSIRFIDLPRNDRPNKDTFIWDRDAYHRKHLWWWTFKQSSKRSSYIAWEYSCNSRSWLVCRRGPHAIFSEIVTWLLHTCIKVTFSHFIFFSSFSVNWKTIDIVITTIR